MWNPSGFTRSSRVLFSAAKSATVTTKSNILTTASTKKAASKTANKNTTATKKSTKPTLAKSSSSSAPSGIMKPIPVSVALQGFVGDSQISRAQAVKKVWEYIKDNNLQNPSDKREIFCDAKLKKLFDGKDKVGFLQIAKLLAPHFHEPAK